MPKITYIEHDGTSHTVEAEVGATVVAMPCQATATLSPPPPSLCNTSI